MQLLLLFVPTKLIALILGTFFFNRLPVPYKLLFYQGFLSVACESYGYYLGTVKNQNNVWIFCYYFLIDSWLLGMAGAYFIASDFFKKAIPVLLLLTTLIWFLDIWVNGFTILPNRFFVSYSILLIIIYIGVLFNPTFTNSSIFKNPVFWVAISSILYYGCIIPYVGLWNYLMKNAPKLANSLFDTNLALNFIR